jgi:hypothetical protein
VEVQLHAFLTLALDGGEWSASHSSRFTPRERAPGTHWIGGWVSLRVGLDAVVKKTNSQPLPGLEPPIIQPVAQRYTTELSWLHENRLCGVLKHRENVLVFWNHQAWEFQLSLRGKLKFCHKFSQNNHTAVRYVIVPYVIDALSNAFSLTIHEFPVSIRIECLLFDLKPFLHCFCPRLLHVSDAVSSVLILQLSRISWWNCSLTSTHRPNICH